MRAAGAWTALQPGQSGSLTQDPVVGTGRLARRVDFHPPAAHLVALAQGQVDRAFRLGRAPLHHGPVDLLDLAGGEQPAQPRQGLAVTAEHQAAAGVAVEPVGQRRRLGQPEAQGVEVLLEVGAAARSGMHRHAGWLVDDQDQAVAVENPLQQPQRRRQV